MKYVTRTRLIIIAIAAQLAAILTPECNDVQRIWLWLGVVLIAILVLSQFRGVFLTKYPLIWAALSRRRSTLGNNPEKTLELLESDHTLQVTPQSARVTKVLRFEPNMLVYEGFDYLAYVPLDFIGRFLYRFGVKAHSIRVSTKQMKNARGAVTSRNTWVSITFDTRDNLDALAARSANCPLEELAESTAFRLINELVELGYNVYPEPPDHTLWNEFGGKVTEKWSELSTVDGAITTHSIIVNNDLPETLDGIWNSSALGSWTVIECLQAGSLWDIKGKIAVLDPSSPPSIKNVHQDAGNVLDQFARMNPHSTRDLDALTYGISDKVIPDIQWETNGLQRYKVSNSPETVG